MLRVLERAYLVLCIGFWVAWSNFFKELQHWLTLSVGKTDHKIISFHSNLSCIFWHKYMIFEPNFTFYWIPHFMTHILLSHSQTGVTWVTLNKAHTSDRIKKKFCIPIFVGVVAVRLLSHVTLFRTPGTAACD